MGVPVEKLGTTVGPITTTVDPERALAYADATNDDNPAYKDGTHVPPVFGVVAVWDAMVTLTGQVVPPEALPLLVHGEQDMHFRRPLAPGLVLSTTALAHSLRVAPAGTRVTARTLSLDGGGDTVLETYATLFLRGVTDGESAGPDKPDHTFPEDARARPAGAFTLHVDDDQTFRYAAASGDHNPIHTDEAIARAVGLPGIIVHGLCTMAMCSQAVVRTVGAGDPGRLRRLAVRFARNVLPGSDLTVNLFDVGAARPGVAAYAFEAESRGERVVAHGRAEVGEP